MMVIKECGGRGHGFGRVNVWVMISRDIPERNGVKEGA